MENTPPTYLQKVVGRYKTSPLPATRPYVTLTFAQSLDAKIAGSGGHQLILSGKESMKMTHWMRTMHDAILIGIGTAINDDPQLNVRHLPPPLPISGPHRLPRPVIIDTHLRLPPTCKLLRNFRSGNGRRPWIICGLDEASNTNTRSLTSPAEAKLQRKQILEAAGAKIIEIPLGGQKSGKISIPASLQSLRDLGMFSVMVEGGAHIIASFLAEAVVDSLIITTAPLLVGSSGIGYEYPTILSEIREIKVEFEEVHTELFGRDSVTALISTASK